MMNKLMILTNSNIKSTFKSMFQVCKIMNEAHLLESVEKVFVE